MVVIDNAKIIQIQDKAMKNSTQKLEVVYYNNDYFHGRNYINLLKTSQTFMIIIFRKICS